IRRGVPPAPPTEVDLLTEIRDLLSAQQAGRSTPCCGLRGWRRSFVVRWALAVVPIAVALIRLRFPPTRLVFVGRSIGQRRPFLIVGVCAACEAARSIHDAIVASVIGWERGARHFRVDRPRGDNAMVDQERVTGPTDEKAGKAAKLGGQAFDKATAMAGQLAQKAGPVAGQARDRAVEMAQKAAPVAGQARDKAVEIAHKAAPVAAQARDKAVELAHTAGPVAAHGVETTARKLDELTHGKYSDQL